MARDLNFEVTSANDLNKMLTGVLMDIRRGEIDHETAKGISLVADKINKNNTNMLEYERLTKKRRDIEFFENENK